MEEVIEQAFKARIIRWAEPDGEGGQLWEVITPKGALLRADSLHLLINALAEEQGLVEQPAPPRRRPYLRLAA